MDDIDHWKNNTHNEFIVVSSKYQLLCYRNTQKVFFGFNERATLYLLLVVLFSRRDIFLLLTNNLARGRRSKIRFIYRLLSVFSKVKYIVHSDHEKTVLEDFGVSLDCIRIRPHWLLIRNSYSNVEPRKYDVALFGPIKVDKDLQGFQDLFSLGIPFQSLLLVKLESLTISAKNITRVNNRLNREEWLDLFKSSNLVFIPLGSGYEGKLSGIYMDSISCGCQVIISNIEPYSSILSGEQAASRLKNNYIHLSNPEAYTLDLELVRSFYDKFE